MKHAYTTHISQAPLDFVEIHLMQDFEDAKDAIDGFVTSYYNSQVARMGSSPPCTTPKLPLVSAKPMTVFAGHGLKRGGFIILITSDPREPMDLSDMHSFGYDLAIHMIERRCQQELRAFITDGETSWWLSRHRVNK